MKRDVLIFLAPGRVEVQSEPLPPGKQGQVLVRSICSGISTGTEMLIFRGLAPTDMPVDTVIPELSGPLTYPLKYGYSLVGEVIDAIGEKAQAWIGQQVFAFHPHESHFWTYPHLLHPLPPHVHPDDAIFLANMETAVNFLQDAAPLLGEQALVFGQGVVGLLTTALLARVPLAQIITLDPFPLRRELSLSLGASIALDPKRPQVHQEARAYLQTHAADGLADLAFELSGAPQALQQAIELTGFGGRIIIGSWYGKKSVPLKLGGAFHRNRIHLISSQVSTLAPKLTGRWDKARRLQLAWHWIAELRPSELITDRVPFSDAASAYALLESHPEKHLQIAFQFAPTLHSE